MKMLVAAFAEALFCTGLIVALKPYGQSWGEYRDVLVQERVMWVTTAAVFVALSAFFWFCNTR